MRLNKLVIIFILCKSILFVYILNTGNTNFQDKFYKAAWGIESYDSRTYYEPLEGLINSGTYDCLHDFGDFRMPGLGFPYLIFRLMFERDTSLNMMILFQFLFSTISLILLGKLAFHIFKDNKIAYLTMGLYSINYLVFCYDTYLLTESCMISALTIAIYLLVTQKYSYFNLLLIGGLTGWAIFLKPFVLPLLGLFGLFIFIRSKDTLVESRLSIIRLMVFLLPFTVCDSVWMIRNYIKYKQVFLLTRTNYYPAVYNDFTVNTFKFLQSTGATIQFWIPGTNAHFLLADKEPVLNKEQASNFFIYTSVFNFDSILNLRSLIQRHNISSDQIEKSELNARINNKLILYTNSIKKERVFLYYFWSRVKHICLHLSNPVKLFILKISDKDYFKSTYRIAYIALYIFTLLGGMIGFILWFKTSTNKLDFLVISLFCSFFLFAVPFFLKMDEQRYLAPAYPFLTILFAFFLNPIKNLQWKHRI